MDNSNYWPYTNIHELNLDWIIAKVKELDTRFTDDIETFIREYIDEHFAEWTVNANYRADDETIIYTNGTGATLTAGDVIRFAIDNAFVNIKDPTARTAAGNAADAAAAAQGTADNNAADIAAMDTAYKAADTTINNKIGTLSDLVTPVKKDVVSAINSVHTDITYTDPGNNYIVRRYGHIVEIEVKSRSNYAIGWNIIGANVPEEYRPTEDTYFVMIDNDGTGSNAFLVGCIYSAGNIRVYSYNALENHLILGTFVFIK